MSKHSIETTYFINELDAAVKAHLNWVRRVLRCAVLRTTPDDDMVAPQAYTLCQFGRWFASNKPKFEVLDPQKAQRLGVVHQYMHDAIRSICIDLLAGRGGESTDLDIFEQTQSELVNLLAEFKTQVLAFPFEPVPWALKWSNRLSVNIPQIDAEHRRFMQLADEFNEVIALGKSLAEIQKCMQTILDDAEVHFHHEESLLREWGYPDTEAHTQKHAQVLLELRGIMENIQGGAESAWVEAGLQVKRVLIEHILIEDMTYRDYFLQAPHDFSPKPEISNDYRQAKPSQ